MSIKLVCYAKKMPSFGDVKSSNRLPGNVEDYNTVPTGRVEELETKIQEASSLEELVDILDEMGEDHLAIVGSRDYCYRADAMSSMTKLVQRDPAVELSVLTRSFGLRAKVIELLAA